MAITRKALVAVPEVEPSREERYNLASVRATQARGAFLVAALDLENSARDLDGLLVDIENEIDHLIELRSNVEYDRDSFLESAKRLKSIVEPELTLF
jgi:hypothetical protein